MVADTSREMFHVCLIHRKILMIIYFIAMFYTTHSMSSIPIHNFIGRQFIHPLCLWVICIIYDSIDYWTTVFVVAVEFNWQEAIIWWKYYKCQRVDSLSNNLIVSLFIKTSTHSFLSFDIQGVLSHIISTLGHFNACYNIQISIWANAYIYIIKQKVINYHFIKYHS